MQHSSDSIAQLAAALAKAQAELVNPTKTLTGIIDRWGNGGEGRSYRYAPLSAGLEIVRKALCKHELAVIQTTHVDQKTETVMLTTTLAHGSGEYISASWPVCRTADMTNPKLMGAALTYARRYGLFTLVGIAGEDDLDAPELPGQSGKDQAEPTLGEPATHPILHNRGGEAGVAEAPFARTRRKRRDAGVPRGPRTPASSIETATRELRALDNADALFTWALRVLPLRNTLPESSRQELDTAFFARAEELGADPELFQALASRPALPNGLDRHPSA